MASISRFETLMQVSRSRIDTELNPVISQKDLHRARRIDLQQRLFHSLNLHSTWFMPPSVKRQSEQMAIGAIHQDLNSIKNQNPTDKKIQKAVLLVEQTLNISVFNAALRNTPPPERQTPITQYANRLKDDAKRLGDEDRMLVPIGTSEHAMLLELICKVGQGQRTYQAKVFNSGEGRFWHESPNLSSVQTLVINNIQHQQIENSDLFDQLFELQLEHVHAHRVYQKLHQYLIVAGGGVRQNVPNPALVHHAQGEFSDACASKCLNFWLNETVGTAAYRQIKVMRTKDSIKRLEQVKAVEEKVWYNRWFSKPNFFNRVLYFLFNFIPIDAQIALGNEILQKRINKANKSV